MGQEVDVCVYGATPAGCVAAVAAKQEGANVVLVEPSRWLGGILGAGIKPMQDCAQRDAVGGLTHTTVSTFGCMPPAIRAGFGAWLASEGIPVVYEHRIESLTTTSGRVQHARFGFAPPDEWGVPAPEIEPDGAVDIAAGVYIDASYEGDLMAAAGVAYRTGREARTEYGEEPAGVGEATNWTPIDPYVVPGRPESGLVPMVVEDHGVPIGGADTYTQAYNFRIYFTHEPNRIARLTPPDDYDADDYELVGRFVTHIVENSADENDMMQQLRDILPGWLNEGEYNYQRRSLITMAPLGLSREYQDGDWRTRSEIWRQHIDYLRGLHFFLSTHERVPAAFRTLTRFMGLDRVMHPETHGWPHQLYVRVARRMYGRYTLTHADVLNRTSVDDGVGLALYGVDSYPARRYACRDQESGLMGVATEGNMFLGGPMGTGHPYAVPYRAITPSGDDCTNLLVPVCFSATHIAYASARMEPVFCVLGESAGVAAAFAARNNSTVQDVDVDKLRARLAERGQILEWPVTTYSSGAKRTNRLSRKPTVEPIANTPH